MRTTKIVSMFIVLFVVLLLVGCSSPSSGVIDEAIRKHIGTVKSVESIDVTNKFSRTINGEEVWTIEFEAEVIYTDETARTIGRAGDKFKDKIRIVKRGNAWRRV